MDKMKDVALLAGRVLLALMFVMAGWGKIGGYAGTQGYMEAMGVPGFMLPLVILLELGGGLAIMLGLFTRSLSVLLAGLSGAADSLSTGACWSANALAAGALLWPCLKSVAYQPLPFN